MAQNYTRQSAFSDGDTITATLFNDEYNQLVNTFTYSSSDASATGHRHDGSTGEGGNIYRIGDLDFLNKIEADSSNNRWGFWVEVSSIAVEQLRIQDGAIVPVTDNDIDLGTSSLEFKNLYLDGTAKVDALVVDETATITGAATLSSDLTVAGNTVLNGNTTIGNAATDTVTITADVSSNFIPSADSTYTLGDSSNYWSAGYIDAITTTGNVSVGGNLTVTGNATISGNLTFGDADTDTVSFSADVSSHILPDVDDTYDLGSSTKEWRNLYVDGTANIDSLVADTADINGGTIDGAIIATSDVTVGAGKTLDVSAGTLTLADNQISGDKVEGGTIAATTITSLASTTVDTTNIEVTNLKAKDGTAAGFIADATGVVTLASSVLTTTDINGGTIDGATIGATTPAAGTFTTGDFNTSLNVDGTVTADGLTVDGAVSVTDSTYSIYSSSAAATIGYVGNTANDLNIYSSTTGHNGLRFHVNGILPTDNTGTIIDADADLGDPSYRFKDLHLSGTASAGGLTVSGTTSLAGASTTADITFGDNDKAVFGAGSDLQIYSDGDSSYLKENSATGSLFVDGDNIRFRTSDGSKSYALFTNSGSARLYHDNSIKIETTATGIDVSGTVTADGLTVDGAIDVNLGSSGSNIVSLSGASAGRKLDIQSFDVGASVGAGYSINATSGQGELDFQTAGTSRLNIDAGGDISFYEDTGTTAQLVWDASADALTFGDSVKATFGAGSDLEIYHDGSHSYISDQGTGNLRVLAENFQVRNPANNEAMIIAIPDAGVTLYYDNADKLATTSTGIDVTGTVTADGLTVDTDTGITLKDGADTRTGKLFFDSGVLQFRATGSGDVSFATTDSNTRRLLISGNTGDISFYEDTGTTESLVWDSSLTQLKITGRETSRGGGVYAFDVDNSAQSSNLTSAGAMRVKGFYGDSLIVNGLGDVSFFDDSGNAKFFWDASAESLGIGDTTPSFNLDVTGDARIGNGITVNGGAVFNENSLDVDFRVESDANTHMLFVDAGNNAVGVGDSAPEAPLHVQGSGGATTSVNKGLIVQYDTSTAILSGGGTGIVLRGKSSGGNIANYEQAMIASYGYDANNQHGLSFWTKPNASTALTAVAYFEADGEFVVQGGATFNEGQGSDANDDFRVATTSNASMLFVDAGNDRVAVGTSDTATHTVETGVDATMRVNNGLKVARALTTSGNDRDVLMIDTPGSWSSTGNITTQTYLSWGNGGDNIMGRVGLRFGGSTITGGQSEISIKDLYESGYAASGTVATFGSNNFTVFQGGATVNEGSYDQDFRVESDTNTHAIFVDAQYSRVGVNTTYINNGTLQVQANSGAQAVTAKVATDVNSLFQGFNSSDALIFQVTGSGSFVSNTDTVFNDNGADLDFRVESASNTHFLYLDAGLGRLHVNGISGVSALNVRDTMAITNTGGVQYLLMGNQDSAGVNNPSMIVAANGAIEFGNGDSWGSSSGGTFSQRFSISANGVIANENSYDQDFRVESDSNSHMLFVDAGQNTVGVNVSNPAPLTSGVISPKLIVDNAVQVRSGFGTVLSNPNGLVFTLATAGNGASTFLILEGADHVGYRRTYFKCTNFSGNWTVVAHNAVTEGTAPTFTIANNSTANPTITLGFNTSYGGGYVTVTGGNSYWSVS